MTEQEYDEAGRLLKEINELGIYEVKAVKFYKALSDENAEYKVDGDLFYDWELPKDKEFLLKHLELYIALLRGSIGDLKREFEEL